MEAPCCHCIRWTIRSFVLAFIFLVGMICFLDSITGTELDERVTNNRIGSVVQSKQQQFGDEPNALTSATTSSPDVLSDFDVQQRFVVSLTAEVDVSASGALHVRLANDTGFFSAYSNEPMQSSSQAGSSVSDLHKLGRKAIAVIRDALKVFQSNSKPSTSGGNQKQEIQMSDSGSQVRRLHEGVTKRSHFVPAIRQPVSPEIVVRCQPLLPRSAKTSGTTPKTEDGSNRS
jgi:hypothetical protein